MNSGSGNKVADDDFLKVLLALKKNVMRSCNVAEVCKVESIKDDKYQCELITTGEKITCYSGLNDIEVNQIVIVLFSNTDFRSILKRIKSGKSMQHVEEDPILHTKDNGIIIGILYDPRNREE